VSCPGLGMTKTPSIFDGVFCVNAVMGINA